MKPDGITQPAVVRAPHRPPCTYSQPQHLVERTMRRANRTVMIPGAGLAERPTSPRRVR